MYSQSVAITVLDVPLVEFVRKLLTESLDVFFHLGNVGILVERVY